jgi:hypothetical protein
MEQRSRVGSSIELINCSIYLQLKRVVILWWAKNCFTLNINKVNLSSRVHFNLQRRAPYVSNKLLYEHVASWEKRDIKFHLRGVRPWEYGMAPGPSYDWAATVKENVRLKKEIEYDNEKCHPIFLLNFHGLLKFVSELSQFKSHDRWHFLSSYSPISFFVKIFSLTTVLW